MKVMICGSMTFAKEMFDVQKKLEALGHEALVPDDRANHAENPGLIDDLDKDREYCIESQVMEKCFKKSTCMVYNYSYNEYPWDSSNNLSSYI